MPSNSFFSRKSCLYEIMWRNITQPGRPQTTIWCMRIACWIPKATNTHSDYVTLTSGYTNAPQCYVIRTLSVLLKCKLLPSSPYTTSLDCTLCIIRLLIWDVPGDGSATVVLLGGLFELISIHRTTQPTLKPSS